MSQRMQSFRSSHSESRDSHTTPEYAPRQLEFLCLRLPCATGGKEQSNEDLSCSARMPEPELFSKLTGS